MPAVLGSSFWLPRRGEAGIVQGGDDRRRESQDGSCEGRRVGRFWIYFVNVEITGSDDGLEVCVKKRRVKHDRLHLEQKSTFFIMAYKALHDMIPCSLANLVSPLAHSILLH